MAKTLKTKLVLTNKNLDRLFDDAKSIFINTAKPKFIDSQQFITLCHLKAFANLAGIELDLKAIEETLPHYKDDE